MDRVRIRIDPGFYFWLLSQIFCPFCFLSHHCLLCDTRSVKLIWPCRLDEGHWIHLWTGSGPHTRASMQGQSSRALYAVCAPCWLPVLPAVYVGSPAPCVTCSMHQACLCMQGWSSKVLHAVHAPGCLHAVQAHTACIMHSWTWLKCCVLHTGRALDVCYMWCSTELALCTGSGARAQNWPGMGTACSIHPILTTCAACRMCSAGSSPCDRKAPHTTCAWGQSKTQGLDHNAPWLDLVI